ncbi:unnamed protein product [Amoebophrya sp. A25]|nr:unnamed protein product [Amoebophrya sp. A25]|eukprot:GSA25T00026716001.1
MKVIRFALSRLRTRSTEGVASPRTQVHYLEKKKKIR